MTIDASNSEVNPQKLTVFKPDYVENKDPLEERPNEPARVNQQQLLPTAAQARILGQIITSSPKSNAPGTGYSVSITVPDQATRTVGWTITNNQGKQLIGEPDMSFFLNDITSVNQYPNAIINMRTMPTAYWTDWGLTDNSNIVARQSLYNNTGSTITVVAVIRTRIIENPSTTPKTQNR